MKFLVGSYEKGLYEVDIDVKKEKFNNQTKVNDLEKVSYLIKNGKNIDYIFIQDGKQYAKIGKEDVFIGDDTSCHISYDKINNLYYFSQYHSGTLKVMDSSNNIDTYTFTDVSNIHYSMYIEDLELLGVCDLGKDNVYFYTVKNGKLEQHSKVKLGANSGPRHFVYNSKNNMVYVVTEHSSEIYSLQLTNNTWKIVQVVEMPKGAASAIRKTKDNKFLFAAVRNSNVLVSYEILDDGLLVPLQIIDTFGDHPRDFNLSVNNDFLVAANMKSNTLSLYSLNKNTGILILLEKEYNIPAGASILFI